MPLWALGFSPGVGTGLAGERGGQEKIKKKKKKDLYNFYNTFQEKFYLKF